MSEGLFQYLLREPQQVLSLGAKAHALLIAGSAGSVASDLAAGNWTCCDCSIRLPGLMELHHPKGHAPSRIRVPICQACHDLRHPLWAASRGRLLPVMAPDIAQSDLTSLAWGVAFMRARGKDMSDLENDILARHEDAVHHAGTAHVEAIFEALLTGRDLNGGEAAARAAVNLDAEIRFWPRFAAPSPHRSPILIWGERKFTDVTDEVLDRLSGMEVDDTVLGRAASL